ncbi:TonB-dependent receptor plug [Nitritalea halalkaliphila LW7]|uniref:TonB-dependent receptor plug n=1 Tax=Nitritalea halalkaliphila LW7 TaxID=1189621 RepID=I5BYA6_9BACT|nr:carboxypeptidase-like regulatory domain-containing protein [Nitritalea halalkaliphila]EIM74558.1 TonB-dependent receptor plug [Nitritalea halalkaliphila LW7]
MYHFKPQRHENQNDRFNAWTFLESGRYMQAQAQAKTVKGVVVAGDEEQNPIVGAALVVKGTTKGTTTGRDGSFTLEIPAGFDVITVSYVGFISKDVKVEDDLEMIIRLEPEPPKRKKKK